MSKGIEDKALNTLVGKFRLRHIYVGLRIDIKGAREHSFEAPFG